MTARKRPKKEYSCSCGLTFGHVITLRRHLKATGHEAGPTREAPVEEEELVELVEPEEPVAAAEEPAPEPFPLREHEEVQVGPPASSPVLMDLGGLVRGMAACGLSAVDRLARCLDVLTERIAVVPYILDQAVRLATVMLAGLVCLGLMLALGAHSLAWARTTPSTPAPALDAITRFYRALDDGRPRQAYALLSEGWRDQLSFGRFRDSRPSGRLTYWIEQVSPIDAHHVRVAVLLQLHRDGGACRIARERLLVVNRGRGWRLDREL